MSATPMMMRRTMSSLRLFIPVSLPWLAPILRRDPTKWRAGRQGGEMRQLAGERLPLSLKTTNAFVVGRPDAKGRMPRVEDNARQVANPNRTRLEAAIRGLDAG